MSDAGLPDRRTTASRSGLSPLPELAVRHGLVVLVGAGVSMLPPTSLPGWRDFNRAVLQAVAERVGRDTNPKFVGERLETLLARREVERAYAPDFLAQIMEEEIGTDYFRVLQALDTQTCNRNHLVIAALARAGVVRAIVTTNFDCLLERALSELGVPHRLFASASDFEAVADALRDDTAPLPLIKAHGSAEHPDTMVDTLAQRVRGRPAALNAAVGTLLDRHACLCLGFSGADLDYDPDYLGLRSAAATACAFTVLVRTGSEPLAAMQALVDACGDRGRIVHGTMPEALTDLAAALGVDTPGPGSSIPDADWQARLMAATKAWIDSMGTMPAVNMFVALVDANGDDPWMIDFLLYFRRYYRTEEHTVDPWAATPAYWRYEYQFGRRLLERGRLTPDQHERDNGQRLLSSSVISFRKYEDALNLLGNATTRGELLEARVAMCELHFWVYGPGRAVALASQTWERIAQTPAYRHAVDAMITISRVYEWSGEYELALNAAMAGAIDARGLGDEPRRAASLVQFARTLALRGGHDEAEAHLRDAEGVAARLALSSLTAEIRAAQGLLDVVRSRDRDAIEPLRAACSFYRQSQRLPRLYIALLDLVRAAYYARDDAELESAQRELYSLADCFPAAEGLICLLGIELARDRGEWRLMRDQVDALEFHARRDPEYPWTWGLGRVQRNRADLAAKS